MLEKPRQRRFGRLCAALALTVALAAPGAASAQNAATSTVRVPDNAHEVRFGKGWQCDPGYRENKQKCDAVAVPDNAFATNSAYGTGWECRRGYSKVDDETCRAIALPAHAFLTENSRGDGWICDRGFKPVGAKCAAVEIPANAHLDNSGRNWDCDRPFRKEQTACQLP